jgi:hypothetical protein
MGRVRLNIKVKKQPCWTLFDAGHGTRTLIATFPGF